MHKEWFILTANRSQYIVDTFSIQTLPLKTVGSYSEAHSNLRAIEFEFGTSHSHGIVSSNHIDFEDASSGLKLRLRGFFKVWSNWLASLLLVTLNADHTSFSTMFRSWFHWIYEYCIKCQMSKSIINLKIDPWFLYYAHMYVSLKIFSMQPLLERKMDCGLLNYIVYCTTVTSNVAW